MENQCSGGDFAEVIAIVRHEGHAGKFLGNVGIGPTETICEFLPELGPIRISHYGGTHGGGPSKVIVGIRPEHVVVGARAEGLTITGRVAVTENLGHERLVFTETKIGPITQRASDQTVCPTAGDELELTLLRHRLHFFDAVTEERIEMVSDAP